MNGAGDASWYQVNDPDAAAALLDATSFAFLRSFLARERTASEAARDVGASLARTHYHVRRLLSLGLLAVVRTTPRRGRAVKHYRAVSSHFFVPFEVTAFESLEAFAASFDAPYTRAFARGLVTATRRAGPEAARGGVLLHVLPEGQVSVDFTPTPPPDVTVPYRFGLGAWSSWTVLHLTPEEAAALEDELAALWKARLAAHGTPGPGRGAFTLRLGLAPSE